LARARQLLDGKPLPALWFWAATLATSGLDDGEGALCIAREGVNAYPNNPVLQNNLAVLLELSGDVAGAETMLRAALAEDAALPQVSKNLADILYRNGRYDEAAEAYERAAKLNPELGDDLYFKLGNIAYKQRDHARARASWAQATALNPGHQLARANLEMLDLAQ
jgi:tetratricopeptide (TPR) repeat protein